MRRKNSVCRALECILLRWRCSAHCWLGWILYVLSLAVLGYSSSLTRALAVSVKQSSGVLALFLGWWLCIGVTCVYAGASTPPGVATSTLYGCMAMVLWPMVSRWLCLDLLLQLALTTVRQASSVASITNSSHVLARAGTMLLVRRNRDVWIICAGHSHQAGVQPGLLWLLLVAYPAPYKFTPTFPDTAAVLGGVAGFHMGASWHAAGLFQGVLSDAGHHEPMCPSTAEARVMAARSVVGPFHPARIQLQVRRVHCVFYNAGFGLAWLGRSASLWTCRSVSAGAFACWCHCGESNSWPWQLGRSVDAFRPRLGPNLVVLAKSVRSRC